MATLIMVGVHGWCPWLVSAPTILFPGWCLYQPEYNVGFPWLLFMIGVLTNHSQAIKKFL
jgi:hypothetical protein